MTLNSVTGADTVFAWNEYLVFLESHVLWCLGMTRILKDLNRIRSKHLPEQLN